MQYYLPSLSTLVDPRSRLTALWLEETDPVFSSHYIGIILHSFALTNTLTPATTQKSHLHLASLSLRPSLDSSLITGPGLPNPHSGRRQHMTQLKHRADDLNISQGVASESHLLEENFSRKYRP